MKNKISMCDNGKEIYTTFGYTVGLDAVYNSETEELVFDTDIDYENGTYGKYTFNKEEIKHLKRLLNKIKFKK
jgi:hypothetical protein